MSTDPRKCPYCGMAMSADQRTCPDCGNPYPVDDASATGAPDATRPMRARASDASEPMLIPAADANPGRPPRATGPTLVGGPLAGLARYRTALVLIGILVAIIVVGYLLFMIVTSYFGSARQPGSVPSTTPAPVLVPGLPSPGPSPSPSPGTLIQPAPSPSPVVAGVRMKIKGTDEQGANMRQRPSTTAPVLRTLPEGTVVEAIGGETNAEGRGWRNVRDPGGATGWVASDLLGPE